MAAAAAPAGVYQGLGAWIDIYDRAEWAAPVAAVQSLVDHGVRTLYLETGNSAQATAIVRPRTVRAFLDAAHRRRMRVVAWYLPTLLTPDRDFRRIRAAIAIASPAGVRFDGFALDIESSSVRRVAERNRRTLALARRVRSLVGLSYPLGAIIPSPLGMQLSPTYWPAFPYRALGGLVDAFLPMAYSSYHVSGAPRTYDYTVSSVEILRLATGRPTVPIHLIGGIADRLDGPERRAVAQAATAEGVVGVSLYGLMPTAVHGWPTLLAAVPPRPARRDHV